jgi:hypothetical protein
MATVDQNSIARPQPPVARARVHGDVRPAPAEFDPAGGARPLGVESIAVKTAERVVCFLVGHGDQVAV